MMNESILEELSEEYRTIEINGIEPIIFDNPKTNQLLLTPVGYTKESIRFNVSRQQIYRTLYQSKEFMDKSKISFKPQKDNPYDPSAVVIWLENSLIFKNTDVDLGYVPKVISNKIKKNLSRILNTNISSITTMMHGRYYAVTLDISYSPSYDNLFYSGRFENLK